MDDQKAKNSEHAITRNVSNKNMVELKRTWDMEPPQIPSQNTPDWPIYLKIMDHAKDYLGSYCRNELFENFPYPQRLYTLSEMLVLHVLREKGDIKAYLALAEELFVLKDYQPNKMSRVVRQMMQWLVKEMDETFPPAFHKDRVVISMLVFGKAYTDKMLTYTLRSMMASLPALLKEKTVILHIQTTHAARQAIEAADITLRMKGMGIFFHYVIIPANLIDELSSDIFNYWMLGSGATLALHYAKKAGAAFHHSYPDFIYSDKFFSELLRLSKGHNNILAPGMRADESILLPKMENYAQSDVIAIPAPDLLAHHLNSIHISAYHYIVNNRYRNFTYPQSHVLIWEGEETAQFNCPHMNAYWLANQSIKDLSDRFFMTLDSELDLICTGFDYYIPQENDDLYTAEISEQGRSAFNHNFLEGFFFGQFIWGAITHRDLFKFFACGMKTKINRAIRPWHPKIMPDAQIEIEKRFVFNNCVAVDPHKGLPFRRKRSHEGHIY